MTQRTMIPGPVPSSEPHIAVNEKERCLMVRITRQRKLHQFNFMLAQLGTWNRCLKAARAKVKEQLAILPEPVSMHGRMTHRNQSGVVGVRLILAVRRRVNGQGVMAEYPDWRWIAFWPTCPQSGGIGFGVNKYGEDDAFVLAYYARKHECADRYVLEHEIKHMKPAIRTRYLSKRVQMVPGKRSSPAKPATGLSKTKIGAMIQAAQAA